MQKKKISIEDVARRAKVSITTVSRVINNVSTVSLKNRVKVEEAVAHLKFKPDVSAQRLARGFNNSIGLVMPGYPGIFYSFYAVELIRGVGHACETKRLDLIFHITNGNNPLNTTNVGGVIFADVIENRKQIESAIATGTPCLVINNRCDDLDVHYIAVDNILGGRLAGKYLIDLGHKRIATITGNINTQAGLERLQGFKEVLKQNDIDISDDFIFEGDYSRRSARLGAEQFLNLPERPTAIFAASDEMALEVIAVMLENGLKVPEDVSVIGFDDNPSCLFGHVTLSTIKQPLFKMAEDSVYLLHAIMDGSGKKEKQRRIFEPELIVRESCCAYHK